MTVYVAVAFSDVEGRRLEGDSSFDPSVNVECDEGSTFSDILETYKRRLEQQWEMPYAEIVDQLYDEADILPTGFWVVDKKLYEIITNVDVDLGSDSAVYQHISLLKHQLQSAATKTVEKNG